MLMLSPAWTEFNSFDASSAELTAKAAVDHGWNRREQ